MEFSTHRYRKCYTRYHFQAAVAGRIDCQCWQSDNIHFCKLLIHTWSACHRQYSYDCDYKHPSRLSRSIILQQRSHLKFFHQTNINTRTARQLCRDDHNIECQWFVDTNFHPTNHHIGPDRKHKQQQPRLFLCQRFVTSGKPTQAVSIHQ